MDTLDDFHRETVAVLKGSAIFIRAVVPVGDGELVQQITFMHGMNLYAVHPGITQLFRRLSESFHHFVDFLYRHRAGINAFRPAVGRLGSGGTAVFNIKERLGKFAERRILQKVDHHAVDSH